MSHPLSHLEEVLASPPAGGFCVLRVADNGAAAQAGLKPADIIISVEGQSLPTTPKFYEALQAPEGERSLEVLRGGKRMPLRFKAWPLSFQTCVVRKNEAAWQNLPDTDYKPDFSAITPDAQLWLRNSLGDELAGFEHVAVTRRGDLLEVKTLFRLSSGEGEEAWDYRTRGEAVVRMEKGLPAVETRFWQGLPGEEKLHGDLKLANAHWVGLRADKQVKIRAEVPILPAYIVTLLPLTMPLRQGVRQNYFAASDGTADIREHCRIECVGLRKTRHLGKEIDAWCFAWRHYGVRDDAEDEKFWVSDDRRLLRIDWGPNYGGCWCELVPREDVLRGAPARIKIE